MTTTVKNEIPGGVLTFEEIKNIADNGWAIISIKFPPHSTLINSNE